MKAHPALQDGSATPGGAATPVRTDGVATASVPGATSGEELSPQQVNWLLDSTGRHRSDATLDDGTDGYDGGTESDHPQILFGPYRKTVIEVRRASHGGLDDSDSLRAAHGVLAGLVLAASMWGLVTMVMLAL